MAHKLLGISVGYIWHTNYLEVVWDSFYSVGPCARFFCDEIDEFDEIEVHSRTDAFGDILLVNWGAGFADKLLEICVG